MPESTWVKDKDNSQKNDAVYRWIRENKQTVWSIIAIIVAAIIIAIVIFINLSKNKETAEKYYFVAQQYYAAGKMDEALEQLDIIEKNFSKYPSGDFARLLKGDIYFTNGNYPKAIEAYINASRKISNKELVPFASYSVAKTYQALKDYDKAIPMFSTFVNAYPDHYLTPEVYMSLAISYETKGQNDLAKETYQKITILYPQTQWESIAREALKKYESKSAVPQSSNTQPKVKK
ncbi:MAG: tetratricopeptide repeat protein [Elusimicrobia bacterium]|jgi:tetratricopeptide (TPR) repeat protein|nr:tetratricopeptide repeat protein [Elusimicrobiota bacterium]